MTPNLYVYVHVYAYTYVYDIYKYAKFHLNSPHVTHYGSTAEKAKLSKTR